MSALYCVMSTFFFDYHTSSQVTLRIELILVHKHLNLREAQNFLSRPRTTAADSLSPFKGAVSKFPSLSYFISEGESIILSMYIYIR